jgi:hypothetical protein
VESLNKICEQLSQAQIEEYFIPLVVRLSKADWFTSKISATGLYNVPYSRATPPSQEGLRQQYGALVHDDTPMVRRQAASNLAKFIKTMPAAIVIEEMILLFQHLASDDQDSVRLLTVDILIAIAEAVPKEQQSSHGVLLTALRSLFEDKSWRVRYMVADRFEKVGLIQYGYWDFNTNTCLQIAKAVDEEVVSRDLVPSFVKLLKDTEAEVRSAIAGQIPGMLLIYIFRNTGNDLTMNRVLRLARCGYPSSRCYAKHRRACLRSVSACPSSSWHSDQRAGPDPRQGRVSPLSPGTSDTDIGQEPYPISFRCSFKCSRMSSQMSG